MSKNHTPAQLIFGFVLISILSLFFQGCASIPKADPVLVSKYTLPVSIDKQETLIYVIRQENFVGAAQGLWVACNDKYIADLSSGSYTYFKMKADINTVNLRQMKTPVFFKNVDFRPGETVFLYFEYGKGLYEIDKDVGKTIVMQYKKIEDASNPDKSIDFEMGLMNPGFLGLPLMKESKENIEPDANNATVTFIRSQSFAENLSFGIWNQQGLLGNLKGKTHFVSKLSSGKHVFVANGYYGNYYLVNAELAAGKKYYVMVEVSMGWMAPNLHFFPVKNDIEPNEIQEKMNQSMRMAIDTNVIDAKIKKRLDAALPLVQRTIDNMKKGNLEAPSLEPKDGR